MASFRAALAKRLEELGLTQRQFAQRIGYQTNNATVTKAIRGERPVPLDDLEGWLDALELDSKEREHLWRMAIDDYAPKYVKHLVERLDRAEGR